MADADIYNKVIKTSQDGLARRSAWKIKIKGVDCTEAVMKDLLSIDITDNENASTDDFQLKLADADGKWVQRWLTETIYKGATVKGLKIEAWVGVMRDDKVVQQKAGTFYLDSIKAGGPPSTVTMKASSMPQKGGIADENRSKAWEAYTLKGIADEIAKKAGLKLIYRAQKIEYERREQNEMTDLAFLRALCNESGICIKITDGKMVLLDAEAYAKEPSVMTIRFGDGSYTKWDLETGSRDSSYDSCIVRYAHPEKGLITGSAESKKYKDNEDHNQLVITNRRVDSRKEAEKIAAQELRLKNEYSENATFTIPGNPGIMAGQNVTLEGFGYWDGKHAIKSVKHKLSSSGYTTEIKLGESITGSSRDYDNYTLGSGQIVRIGTVVDVSGDKKKARVKFTGQGIVSDWLYVAQFPEWGSSTQSASHIHHIAEKWGAITDSLGGSLSGDATDADGAHSHPIKFIQWFPRVNDNAICLFPSGSDSHGYIVGCI